MTKKEILEMYKLDLDDENENNCEGLYQLFLDYEIASNETLETITSINGYNIKTLLDVLYVKTGLRSIEQLADEMKDEE